MGPSFLEGGPIMYRYRPSVCPSVCPSVRPSVPCLHLEKKRKGLRIPNLVGRIAGTRAPRGPISRSKGQRSRSQDTVVVFCVNVSLITRPSNGEYSTSASGTLLCHRERFTGSKWFTRWQHLMSLCGSTHVVNCKDGPIAGSPSTAAHSC